MQLTFWEIFALFSISFIPSVLTLLGVCVGAYFVLITKREEGASLISNPFSRSEGGAYIAKGEDIDDLPDDMPEGAVDTNDLMKKMNERFLGQTGLGGKS